MNTAAIISSNLLACIILVVILYSFIGKDKKETGSLTALCFVILFFLLADCAYVYLCGNSGQGARTVSFAAKSLYFIGNAVIVFLWARYIVLEVWEEEAMKSLPWTVLLGSFHINVSLVLLNVLTPIIFRISPDGTFSVVPWGMWIFTVMNYGTALAAAVILIIKRNLFPETVYRKLLLFPIPAALAEILRAFSPELDFLCLYAISAFLLYALLRSGDSQKDLLTGLFNRNSLARHLEKWLSAGDGKNIVGIVIDVDDMKKINAENGHAAGDQHLVRVAGILKKLPQKNITVIRYGGDEFVAVWRPKGPEELQETLYKIEEERVKLNKELPRSEQVHFFIDSYSCTSGEGITPEDFMHTLDDKLRIRRREIDVLIDDGLKRGIFEVWYQPIRNVHKKNYPFAEALLRLPNEERGMISPAAFIPAAEKSGAIIPLGEYVIREVCRFLKSEEGIASGFERIDINLSVKQMMVSGMAENFIRIIDEEGIGHERIGFEITESTISAERDILKRNIETLTKSGFSLSLDDFGSGYSNLQRLLSLPFNIVKLDRSFMNQLKEERVITILKNLLPMIHELDLQVLIEGIETPEQQKICTALGFDYIQGYLFARPMGVKKLMEWRNTHH